MRCKQTADQATGTEERAIQKRHSVTGGCSTTRARTKATLQPAQHIVARMSYRYVEEAVPVTGYASVSLHRVAQWCPLTLINWQIFTGFQYPSTHEGTEGSLALQLSGSTLNTN